MTPATLKILRIIDELSRQNGFSPSFEEIGDAAELSSLATVSKHTTKLLQAGMLTGRFNCGRSLELTAKGHKQLLPDGDLALLREALWYIELTAADHDSIGDTDGAAKAGDLASRIRKRVGSPKSCSENRTRLNSLSFHSPSSVLMSAAVPSRKASRARASAKAPQPIALNSQLTQSVDKQQIDIDVPVPQAYKGE